jgi:signal transduction histidine kinase
MSAVGDISQFPQVFQEHLIGLAPQLSSKNALKFFPFERWLEEQLGLQPGDVAVKYVSQEKMIGNRLGELAEKKPALVLLLLKDGVRIAPVRNALLKRVGGEGFLRAGAIVSRSPLGKWEVNYLIEEQDSGLSEVFQAVSPQLFLEHTAGLTVVRATQERTWRELAATAAHKIGNPIFAIETNIYSLQRYAETMSETLGEIRSSLEDAKAILGEMKSLKRAQKVNRRPFRLLPFLELLGNKARRRGFEFLLACPADVIVDGDEVQLGQGFEELLVNAFHWTVEGSRVLNVEVEARAPRRMVGDLPRGEYVLIRFGDNGSGIPQEHKGDIFDAFYTSRAQGTGLGLAIVFSIVEAHGGKIFENGVLGEGALFNIMLPRGRAA